MFKTIYYAHSTKTSDKGDWQLLRTHLTNVANASSAFANDFDASQYAYAAGLLHDIGKYSAEFQRRLEGSKEKVDHSTAGAKEAQLRYPIQSGRVLGYIITGHHGGLLNYGSLESGLEERLSKKIIPDYTSYRDEINLPGLDGIRPNLRPANNKIGFSISFYIRMLYSCLVDADSLDTERFYAPDKSELRKRYDPFNVLQKKFNDRMISLQSQADDSKINRYRRSIYEQCLGKATLPPQMFTLTVPTGGGKTFSSMAFALEHLKKNNLKRIFYVIPYTSIIEQNAAIFRNVLGGNNVLEHHSNFDFRTTEPEELNDIESLRLSAENWDMPVVVTTNVQFFESLFSSSRSRCQKLHNLARSVIIMDEAQMLPVGYLKPCLAALSELVNNYGSSVVLCTATQPKLSELLDSGIKPVEIIDSPLELYEAFKRVNVNVLGEINDEQLSGRLKKQHQALCIVNTRKHAKELYDSLSGLGNCYHLSARMCPVHRRKKLSTIRELLKNGADCRVISTQLIEAGVDIDFPAVYRAMTGIDSIAQAAGRCNREGKQPSGEVYVFKSTEKYGKATSWQRRTAEIGEMSMNESSDPLSISTLASYFQRLYFHEGDEGLDKKRILHMMEERCNELAFPFEDVSAAFRIIENDTKDIIIPYDEEAVSTIEELRSADEPWRYTRKLQGYIVSIYNDEFNELVRIGSVDCIGDRFFILNDKEKYSETTGLSVDKYNGGDMSLLIA